MMEQSSFFIYGAIFLVALIYSSVGHGGASGYLALLALLGYPKETAVPSALVLNVLVAGAAFWAFKKEGYFKWSLAWPFLVGSIPFAFLGGHLRVSSSTYSLLLAAALCLAAWRLWGGTLTPLPLPKGEGLGEGKIGLALSIGAAVGLVSGIIGIGGGVFLSPLLLLMGWATPKETAATSSLFIVLNSLAALNGHLGSFDRLNMNPLAFFVLSAFLGGLIGSRLGASLLSRLALCRTLSLVLVLASVKLIHSVI